MKKIMAAFFLMFVSVLAFALPTPRDIENAVKAGNLAQAETMLREVIAAKPASAKARYELGQVLARMGRPDAARVQLAQAEKLDPSLRFATDPVQFRNLMNQVAMAASTPATPSTTGNVAHPAESGGSWGLLLLGGGVLLILWFVIRRALAPAQSRACAPAAAMSGGAASTGGFGAYGAGDVPRGGGGMGGAVLGGVAGLAAGYGLAKILEGNEAHRATVADDGYAPLESPRPDFGAFDPGRGSDWDGDNASGGGDDGDSW